MSTDPKKNDEIRDEELECVAGGVGGDYVDEQPDGGDVRPICPDCRNRGVDWRLESI